MTAYKIDNKNTVVSKLQSLQLYLSIFVLFIALFTQVIYGFVWKNQTDVKISAMQSRISKLDSLNSTDYEKIIEISINLKTLMEKSGLKYQSVK
jgi:hypothetical protein